MTERFTHHVTFTIERDYNAPPAKVFDAWADPVAKASWFHGPDDWGPAQHELDFRVGGRETSRGGPKGGPVHSYEARFHDIIATRRIIYGYDMRLGDQRISVSLATVEFKPWEGGTRLVYTEQAVFLDGYDDPAGPERGTRELLDALGKVLDR